MTEKRKPDAFDGTHLLVANVPCDECLFSQNKIVSDERKAQLLEECWRGGTYFICHKATLKGHAVICHNFLKSTDGAGNVAIRVAQRFGFIKYVDPACPTKPTATQKKTRKFSRARTADSRSGTGSRPSTKGKRARSST